MRQFGISGKARDRRHTNDASPFARDHLAHRGARAVEDPFQVDRQHLVPFLFAELKERRVMKDARVAHQDVEMAELGDRPLDHRFRFDKAADVRADSECAAPGCFDLLDDARDLFLVAAVDYDVGAFKCETGRDSAADSRAGAGDESGFALKAHRRVSSSLCVRYRSVSPARLLPSQKMSHTAVDFYRQLE